MLTCASLLLKQYQWKMMQKALPRVKCKQLFDLKAPADWMCCQSYAPHAIRMQALYPGRGERHIVSDWELCIIRNHTHSLGAQICKPGMLIC